VNENLMTPTGCAVRVGHTMRFRQAERTVGIIRFEMAAVSHSF